MKTKEIKNRLEYLRQELREERISTGELIELQSLAKYIDPSDVELLEPAGVLEHQEEKVFNVTIDQKNTIWWRGQAEIKANSLKDAQEKLKKLVENEDYDNIDYSEYLIETAQPISVMENLAMSGCDQLIPDINEYDTTYSQTIEFPEQFNKEVI